MASFIVSGHPEQRLSKDLWRTSLLHIGDIKQTGKASTSGTKELILSFNHEARVTIISMDSITLPSKTVHFRR
jgi:hypothetical protein